MERKSTHAPDAPSEAIAFIFGVWGDVADIITHAKFYVSRFRGFGVLIPPIFPISIDLAGRPCYTVIMANDRPPMISYSCSVVASYVSLHSEIFTTELSQGQRSFRPLPVVVRYDLADQWVRLLACGFLLAF